MSSAASLPKTPPAYEETLSLLRQLYTDSQPVFDQLQQDAKRQHTDGVNAKGDRQRRFDIEADEWIRTWIAHHFSGGIIESEEQKQSGACEFGDSEGFHFVIDPVDGSDNFARGLPLSAISVALLPRRQLASVDRVSYALVGDSSGRGAALAARGNGARLGDQQLHTSKTRRLRDAFISCELNHAEPDVSLANVVQNCSGVRTYGCASRALCLVATGALDAHVDIRHRLTPESFLAASLLVTEAGGHICRLDGKALGPFQSLQDRTTLVATSTKELSEEILNALVR